MMNLQDKNTTCCFSGHRDLRGADISDLRFRVAEEVGKMVEQGIDRFICGGADGFDLIAAEEVIRVKRQYPWVKLALILPYPDFGKERNGPIIRDADEVVCAADRYEQGCLHLRNRRMVEESGFLICFLREEKGGTWFTVKQAERLGVNIVQLTTNNEQITD